MGIQLKTITLKKIGQQYTVSFRNDRDVRTIVDLASSKLKINESELKDKINNDLKHLLLIEHNAIDDVRYQIELVYRCYKILMGGEMLWIKQFECCFY